jgi:hypothetical protein
MITSTWPELSSQHQFRFIEWRNEGWANRYYVIDLGARLRWRVKR